MKMKETKGLKREELEAQKFGLLPDRVEMRHRRRRGNQSNIAFASFNFGQFNVR